MMADLEAKQTEIQKNILRISGAIQVLEEEIAKCDEDSSAEVVDIKSGEGTG